MIQPGIYQHYKGKRYEVIGVARHTETEEALVVYRHVEHPEEMWARPVKMFLEEVDAGGERKSVPRFKKVVDMGEGG
jgi:hypothetical protein